MQILLQVAVWFWNSNCKLQIYATSIVCKYICVHVFHWSTNPILLKIDIHVRYTMMHVWNSHFFQKLLLIVDYLQIYLCARFLTDLLELLKKYIHMCVIRWCMSDIIAFFKITIGTCSCKFMQHDFFESNKFVCTVLTELLTQFWWKLIYMYCIRWYLSEIIDFFSKLLLVVLKLCNF